jgi:hypothetical protein
MSDLAALLQQGYAAYRRDDLAVAERHCHDAIAADPRCFYAYHLLAVTQARLGRPEEALASCDMALSLRPDNPPVLSNRADVLDTLGRYEEAVASCDRALSLQPDAAVTLSNRGNALRALKRFDEAMESYDRALALQPEFADCRFNRALLLLLRGSLSTGWQEYEWRRKLATWEERGLDGPEWRGEDLSGRRLLLYGEGGLGDTIQFARFVRVLAAQGGDIVIEVEPPLCGLMQSLAGASQVIPRGNPLPAYDCHLPLASVPFVRAVDATQIPAAMPYLTAEPERVAAWSTRLPEAAFRVGIAWSGEPRRGSERGRAIPPAAFAPLGHIPGVRLIGLTGQVGLEPASAAPAGVPIVDLGRDFAAGPDGFRDLAAVIMQLDLVVTSDSPIAHLAGALGRPVWILLKDVPDWRWLLDRADSPWYPTARLFRQSRRDDWDGVVAAAAGALAPVVPQKTGQPAAAPASRVAARRAGVTTPDYVISLARQPVRRERFCPNDPAESGNAGLASENSRTRGVDALELAFDSPDAAKSTRVRDRTEARTVRHTLAARVSGVAVASVLMLTPFHPFQWRGSEAPAGATRSIAPPMTAEEAVRHVVEPRPPQPPAKAATVAKFDREPRAPPAKPVPAATSTPHQRTAAAAKAATIVASDGIQPAIAAKPAAAPVSTSRAMAANQSPAAAPGKVATTVASLATQPAAAPKSARASAAAPQRTRTNQPSTPASVPAGSLASAKPLKPHHTSPPAASDLGVARDVNHPAAAASSSFAPAMLAAVEAANSELRARGDALFVTGDLTSARLFYRRAAEGGDGQAALQLGETYDPAFLAQTRLIGARADPAVAAHWYQRARELGRADAEILLKGLPIHATRASSP